MNKWKELASIFGLELNEKFKIKYDKKVFEEFYRFTEKGVQWLTTHGEWQPFNDTTEIYNLIAGIDEIVKKPWKPQRGDYYYFWNVNFFDGNCVMRTEWISTNGDYLRWNAGNCFKTEEEAKTKGLEIMRAIEMEFENEI